jgi:N-acetylglucosaminyldiphosphoundecaprenol N-acetyl-beta-D-mannosaminyltransferase
MATFDRRTGHADRRRQFERPRVERREATEDRRRISLMEMPIDSTTEQEVVDAVGEAVTRGRGGWVITPNLDHLRLFRSSDDVRRHFENADLVVADGMPLVWASRIQDTPLPERVAGSDLIWSLTKEAERRQASIYLVGGNPGSAEQAGEILRERAPGVEIAGTDCPPMGFESSPGEVDSLAERLDRSEPDIVYVGLPLDKQVALIPRLRRVVPSAWFLGLGISFSFVSGEVRRASGWMQRTGLEWVHRLMQEPRRLFRRYLIDGLPFAARLFAHAARRRWS